MGSNGSGPTGIAAKGMELMVSAHMDDFKGTGRQRSLNWLRDILSEAFGGDVKMEQEREFIRTGIKHTRIEERTGSGHTVTAASGSDNGSSLADTKVEKSFLGAGSAANFYYVLDQKDYASAVKPVSVPELMTAKDEDELVGLLLSCFLTLLGAVAWLLQTRMEIAVYVSALQRRMHQPRALDLRRLNRVIRWVQRNPKGITYRQLPEPRILSAVGDSAFSSTH